MGGRCGIMQVGYKAHCQMNGKSDFLYKNELFFINKLKIRTFLRNEKF